MATININHNELNPTPYSGELNSVLDFAHLQLAQELPTLGIDRDYFILSVLTHKKNFLYGYLDEKLMSTSMEVIYNSFYQVVSSKALSAVRPNRQVIMTPKMQ